VSVDPSLQNLDLKTEVERWAFFLARCGYCGTTRYMGVNVKRNAFMCYTCFEDLPHSEQVEVGMVGIPYTVDVGERRPPGWKCALELRLYETYGLAAELKQGALVTFEEIWVSS